MEIKVKLITEGCIVINFKANFILKRKTIWWSRSKRLKKYWWNYGWIKKASRRILIKFINHLIIRHRKCSLIIVYYSEHIKYK